MTPILTLGDLDVSPLTAADVEAFVAYRRDPDVARLQSWSPDYTADDARRLLESQKDLDFPVVGGWMQFGIRPAGGSLLGDIAVHRLNGQPDTFELGVTLAAHGQGQGIATRVFRAMTVHLFAARDAHRVYAECDTRNAAMKAVLARVGFRHEGTALEADWFKGEWTTLETWAVLARDLERRPIDGGRRGGDR